MPGKDTEKLSFLQLAKVVLEQAHKPPRPMTADEIWDFAVTKGLDRRLRGTGKTPNMSMGSNLYVNVKKPDSLFAKIGARPARFALKAQLSVLASTDADLLSSHGGGSTKKTSKTLFTERQLHPLIVRFADERLGVHCKTILHEKSLKKGEKHNQWIHPDVVGFSLKTKDWEAPVVHLTGAMAGPSVSLYSFEVKIALEYSTLREYFFQAVSNSSWANQGYLVASSIDEDQEFVAELRRLSQSFGIGVIHLNLDEPADSEVRFPARDRETVDWETVNRIVAVNPDFGDFIASVTNSIKINEPAIGGFDKVLDDEDFEAYLRKIKSA